MHVFTPRYDNSFLLPFPTTGLQKWGCKLATTQTNKTLKLGKVNEISSRLFKLGLDVSCFPEKKGFNITTT